MTRTEEKIASIEGILKEIRDRLEIIESKNERIEQKFKEQNKILNKIESVVAEFEQLKKEHNQMKSENISLSKRISELEKNEEYAERNRLRNKIEIIGIPESQAENVKEEVTLIASIMGIKVNGEDIITCYREKDRSGKAGRIIAEFRDSQLRDKIMKEAKKKKPKLGDLKREPARLDVYVNEILTKKTKNIYFNAKKLMQEKKWFKIWIYAGNVYIKQESASNHIKIEGIKDLEILAGNINE